MDLAFAGLAFASGLLGVSLSYALLVFLGAGAAWGWTRRDVLARMDPMCRLSNAALALGLMAIVLGAAYWIGLTLRGLG
jgi:hypothetical protein